MIPYSRIARFVILHIFLGAAFVFFRSNLTIPEFKEFTLKFKDIRGEKTFNLPEKGAYLLKIWGGDVLDSVTVNSVKVIHSFFRNRQNQSLKEFYYVLTPDIVEKGANTLKISPPYRYTIRLKNCISATNFGVVLPSNAAIGPSEISSGAIAVATLNLLLFGGLLFWGLLKFFNLPFEKLFWKYAFSYLPCLLLLGTIHKLSSLIPFEIYFLRRSFAGLSFLLVAAAQIPMLISSTIREGFLLVSSNISSSKGGILFVSSNLKTRAVTAGDFLQTRVVTAGDFLLTSEKKIAKRVAEHTLVKGWLASAFSDKCVFVFLISLFLDTLLLSFGFEFLAEIIANIAYLALFTAVIIKLKKCRDASQNTS